MGGDSSRGKVMANLATTPQSSKMNKKGVKRKADADSPLDPTYSPADPKAAKVATRRESNRQIKKVMFII